MPLPAALETPPGGLLWLIRLAAIQAVIGGTGQVTRKTIDPYPGRHRIPGRQPSHGPPRLVKISR